MPSPYIPCTHFYTRNVSKALCLFLPQLGKLKLTRDSPLGTACPDAQKSVPLYS